MKRDIRILMGIVLVLAFICASLSPASAQARRLEARSPKLDADRAEEADLLKSGAEPADGSLTLNPTSMTVPVFSGYFGVRIHAYIDGVEQSPFDITWSTSSSYVASVDNVGCVYASSTGTATITARAQNGRTATCTVTVVSNSSFTKVNQLNYTHINQLSYVNNQVSIGPLYGGEPVILRRFRPRSGERIDNPGNNPNANNGWAFSYATGFRFSAQAGHDYTIQTEAYAGQQDHDVEVFISVYNSNFDLVSYAYSVHTGEYPTLNIRPTSSGYWYVVLTPVNLSNQWGNGYIKFKLIDPSAPPPPDGMLGDVDHNGTINIADAVLVLRHALGLYLIPSDDRIWADVTGEGDINVADALTILRYAMGLINSFSIDR